MHVHAINLKKEDDKSMDNIYTKPNKIARITFYIHLTDCLVKSLTSSTFSRIDEYNCVVSGKLPFYKNPVYGECLNN